MDKLEDHRMPDLKRKSQVVELAEANRPFDYNKDDTPVKESDHVIEDENI